MKLNEDGFNMYKWCEALLVTNRDCCSLGSWIHIPKQTWKKKRCPSTPLICRLQRHSAERCEEGVRKQRQTHWVMFQVIPEASNAMVQVVGDFHQPSLLVTFQKCCFINLREIAEILKLLFPLCSHFYLQFFNYPAGESNKKIKVIALLLPWVIHLHNKDIDYISIYIKLLFKYLFFTSDFF